MIIGINGKIGAGKDTVGSIIQYLTAADTGEFCLNRIHSGKSIEGHHNSIWEIKKFAGKLKQIASLLTGIPVEKFEDQEFKKAYLEEQWGTVRSNPMNAIPIFEDVGFNELMSIREFLQKLGTEAIRDGLHPNAWVNALFADYKAGDPEYDAFYPNWIITDMRFPNELEAVEEREGITIRVVRGCSECGGIGYHKMSCSKQYEKQHPSETAIDDAKFDYEIINDGSMEDLIEKVRQILITEKIIL
jgi:hypothetical protein